MTVIQRDARALLGEALGNGAADALRRASDENAKIPKPPHLSAAPAGFSTGRVAGHSRRRHSSRRSPGRRHGQRNRF
ncbi:hypothetical protein K32_39260 [Kaistia sp. 32K]|nr:hypothetical protein K32_39260 [Kaistia sp. 32K]